MMEKDSSVSKRFIACALVALLIGICARYYFALELHSARHSVVSDSRNYFATAWRMISEHRGQVLRDTIWPPGVSSLLGVFLIRGANMWHAEASLFILSLLALFCIIDSARILFGRGAALCTCIFASLHLGLYYFSGYFLSETPFMAFFYLAIWLAASATRASSLFLRAQLLFFAGLAFGLSYSMRTIVLPVLIFGLLPFLKKKHALNTFLLCFGFFLMLAPLAHRCTSLSDTFCLGAHNGAMNVTLGHYGRKMGIIFKDSRWMPSSKVDNGVWVFDEVPYSIFEGPQLLAMMAKEMISDPIDTLITGAYNVCNLFEVRLWPNRSIGRLDDQVVRLHLYLYFLLVGIPALLFIGRKIRSWSSGAPAEKSAILGLGGLCVATALTMGEARYRIPFDGVLIVLGSLYYTAPVFGPVPLARSTRWLWQIAALFCLCSAIIIIVVSHPGIPGRDTLIDAARLRRYAATEHVETMSLDDFPKNVEIHNRKAKVETSYNFSCEVDCRGLKVLLPDLTNVRALQLSLEDNDEYQVQFFQDDALISTNYRGPWYSEKRVFRPYTVPVGPSFRNAANSYLVITPFFGDGTYKLGHVALLPMR